MFTPSRDEARRFLAQAWRKYRDAAPLSTLEARVVAIVTLHPEYQPLLEDPDAHLATDYTPEGGVTNPFLHLSLHLAVDEQLSIDQPPGLRSEFQRLRERMGDEHRALHAVVECLGEVMWQAQRSGSTPDAELYLECLRRRGP